MVSGTAHVPVVRPSTNGLWHSHVLHSVHEVGDVLDPSSLILIASPVRCSPKIVESTVVVVRAESSVSGSCVGEARWFG